MPAKMKESAGVLKDDVRALALLAQRHLGTESVESFMVRKTHTPAQPLDLLGARAIDHHHFIDETLEPGFKKKRDIKSNDPLWVTRDECF